MIFSCNLARSFFGSGWSGFYHGLFRPMSPQPGSVTWALATPSVTWRVDAGDDE